MPTRELRRRSSTAAIGLLQDIVGLGRETGLGNGKLEARVAPSGK